MQLISGMRVSRIEPEFKNKSEMMSWIRKLEETLADQLPSKPELKGGIEWLRAVINRSLPEYNGDRSPSLEKNHC